ncbi:MAG: hypothetical protein M0Q53_19820 [Prolixibacteraceae bacterium]|nr:hypothetical protein [Prolixibacteraceae bacterium]
MYNLIFQTTKLGIFSPDANQKALASGLLKAWYSFSCEAFITLEFRVVEPKVQS